MSDAAGLFGSFPLNFPRASVPSFVAAQPTPVCTTAPAKAVSWHPFRFPVGIDYLRSLPCEPNMELQRGNAWLPATHVGGPSRGPTDSGGLWFYYARGCSDLQWFSGRTVLVRNRAHAAVRAEQLSSDVPISDREAIRRVATWILKRFPRANWNPLRQARSWAGSNATIDDVIAEAARGLYGQCSPPAFSPIGALRPCKCLGNTTRAGSRRRLLALTPVCGDKQLSLHSEPLLQRLPVDTLVLHKQPQGGGNPLWTTELWDVRGSPALSRHLENASAHPEVVRRARWAPLTTLSASATASRISLMGAAAAEAARRTNASVAAAAGAAPALSPTECVPSALWYTCFACAGSSLERACNGTVAHYRSHHACYFQKKRGASSTLC